MDDPKKLKRDRKRIVLCQKHEVDYIRRIARDYIKTGIVIPSSMRRICRAFLKISKRRK